MEYHLPHELLLIGCGKRIDSVQPEKTSLARKKKCCTPFSCLGRPNGPTERETESRLFDVGGHHRRWMWTPFFRGISKRYRSCRFGSRGPAFCMDTNTFCLDRNGTNDHEQPRSVPLVPMLFGGSYDTPSLVTVHITRDYRLPGTIY